MSDFLFVLDIGPGFGSAFADFKFGGLGDIPVGINNLDGHFFI